MLVRERPPPEGFWGTGHELLLVQEGRTREDPTLRLKFILAFLAAALSSFGVVGSATPASATCTEVPGAEDVGCVESVACAIAGKLGQNCVE